MPETRSRSLRIEDELWERFCALNGTQNEVFRFLLKQCEGVQTGPGLLQKAWERLGRVENMAEETLELVQSIAARGSQVPSAFDGGSAVDNHPKQATCKHCGETFGGPRFATICPECKSNGHTLEPRECPVCSEKGTGGL